MKHLARATDALTALRMTSRIDDIYPEFIGWDVVLVYDTTDLVYYTYIVKNYVAYAAKVLADNNQIVVVGKIKESGEIDT